MISIDINNAARGAPSQTQQESDRQDWNDAGKRTVPGVLEKRLMREESQPPLVCIALLSLHGLLVAVQSATSLTLAP